MLLNVSTNQADNKIPDFFPKSLKIKLEGAEVQ